MDDMKITCMETKKYRCTNTDTSIRYWIQYHPLVLVKLSNTTP